MKPKLKPYFLAKAKNHRLDCPQIEMSKKLKNMDCILEKSELFTKKPDCQKMDC